MKISPLVDHLIESFQCLPGVGPKSAQRMVFYLLERDREAGEILSDSLKNALNQVSKCNRCRVFTESDLCNICESSKRDSYTLCVVESVADVFAIEHSNHFSGRYFVLHGHLSPIDNIGPEQLALKKLFELVRSEQTTELILATNSTLEREATSNYIFESLKDIDTLKITKLALGVPLGGELEYVDGGTLMHALSGRVNLKR